MPVQQFDDETFERLTNKWARGDYGFQAAVAITQGTHIRHHFQFGGWCDVHRGIEGRPLSARPRWADCLDANGTDSASAKFLLALCENIAHGVDPDEPITLNLSRGLWSLDRGNRMVVLTALSDNLLAR